jgi:hypothetical protein
MVYCILYINYELNLISNLVFFFQGNARFNVSFTPTEACDHVVNVSFNKVCILFSLVINTLITTTVKQFAHLIKEGCNLK